MVGRGGGGQGVAGKVPGTRGTLGSAGPAAPQSEPRSADAGTRHSGPRARAQLPRSDSGDLVPGELGVGGEGLRGFWGSALRCGRLVWRQQSGGFAVLCWGRIPIHSSCPISEHRAEALKRDVLPLVLGIPPTVCITSLLLWCHVFLIVSFLSV